MGRISRSGAAIAQSANATRPPDAILGSVKRCRDQVSNRRRDGEMVTGRVPDRVLPGVRGSPRRVTLPASVHSTRHTSGGR